ncbi:MAG: RdgB/HAM1 family non-canonical purine NTP pyrophosphatase [Planctomycetes bacterium]|nr:RdgB/HAM1 family non-canonical purine NTP pyrophosphatase [Planctomycetota bacterium]
MIDLLLATHSAGKIREIREMAEGRGWRWRGLDEYPDVPEAVEDGRTFAENAMKKALYYFAAAGLPALADDSGLEVDFLHGAPGVDSAYYAGHPRDDAANNRKLVASLGYVPPESRTARFRCVMAFAAAGEILFQTEGSVEGRIVDDPRGGNGFGYDPHFFVPRFGRTMAELEPSAKNAISHRGQALRKMLEHIAAWEARRNR